MKSKSLRIVLLMCMLLAFSANFYAQDTRVEKAKKEVKQTSKKVANKTEKAAKATKKEVKETAAEVKTATKKDAAKADAKATKAAKEVKAETKSAAAKAKAKLE
ncbi:hypothetical protein [Flavobacterium noncentrifugens]|uniref:Colicin import membrane protein n=1 Tax=Flavobacterium noncentrifugens TaxID=1128970 RepID=A0A1G8S9T8_9FLAO|nr:hypothetical protein [Flavobacterium noncentrifugens]SDJ25565.1 hypothetical protein SAMN04487935_0452 [Flavobacterium noncentrifugens]